MFRKTIPVSRRFRGKSDEHTLRLMWNCAIALYNDEGATLNDLREAVTMLQETERTAQRVLGGAHPLVARIEQSLRESQAALAGRPRTAVDQPSSGTA